MAAVDNNTDACRICMEKHDLNMCNIFDNNVIPEQILFCTGLCIQNEHGFPSKICPQCLKDLAIAHKFKTSCITAEETFQRQVSKENGTMKVEIEVFASVHPELTDCEDGFEDDWFNDGIKEEVKLETDVFENVGETKTDTNEQDNIKENVKKSRTRKGVTSKRKTVKEVKLKSKVTKNKKKTAVKKEKDKKDKLQVKNSEKKSSKDKKDDTGQIEKEKKNKTSGRKKLKLKYRQLYCDRCDIQFENRAESDAHKKEVHNKLEEWVCEICGKVIMHRGVPYGHIKSHTPPCFQCAHCDYKTYFKPSLRTHMAFHTRERKFQCEYCAKMFLTASSRKGHIRAVHLLERKHKCELCGKAFFTKTKLNMHVDGHNAIKRYECDICHSAFTRREYWKKHLLDQHGITIARARPGRQTTNAMVGEDLININSRRELVVNKVDAEV